MLQGSLENFALDEVLGLLSGTSKTGQLEIAGNRGTGSLVFDEGRLVDGTASYTANGSELEDVMFELLRYDDGTFTFTSREVTTIDNPENVASVLAAAENRLRDWRSIETVVPTLNHHVAPSADLPSEEVTITRAEWAALTVIAAGCPVSLVCDKLDLGEVEGSRCVKNLAERALITVSEPLGGFASVARGAVQNRDTEPVAPAPFTPAAKPAEAETPAQEPTPEPEVAAADESTADSGSTSGDSLSDTLDALTGDRPPMPPIPVPDELVTEDAAPPAPPSPAEISSFGEELTDASELVESADDGRSGGLLARYLKSED
jgi:hypothetical protein